MPHRAGGAGSGVGRGPHFGDSASSRLIALSVAAHGRGGRGPPRRSRQDGGGAGHSVAGRPEGLLSVDRSRHLSRAGSSAGTSPTHRTSPGGDGGEDRPAALGSPPLIGRNVEKRLVASLGLPDSGSGSRPRDLRLSGLARPQSRGVPGQSSGNRADCLPTGETG